VCIDRRGPPSEAGEALQGGARGRAREAVTRARAATAQAAQAVQILGFSYPRLPASLGDGTAKTRRREGRREDK
jgi:hypothetical protein